MLKIFRDLGPGADLVAPMPYADFQRLIDEPPGLHNYWTADYLDDCPDGAIDVLVRSGLHRPSAQSQQLLLPWGGAVAQIPEFATPLAHRSARWIAHPFAIWPGPAGTERGIGWVQALRRDIAGYANGGAYLNFIGDEGPDRVRAAYGEANYGRLAAVKAEWDPGNVFRGNQNIIPAGLPAPPAAGASTAARCPQAPRGTADLGQRYRRAQARSVAATGQRSLGLALVPRARAGCPSRSPMAGSWRCPLVRTCTRTPDVPVMPPGHAPA